MPVPTVRRLLVAVCILGIPGMIVTSIADSSGGALAFGLATAVAVLGLILITSVTAPPAAGDLLAEAAAERVEVEVTTLVGRGADEDDVRRLVRAAVRLGWVQGRAEGAGQSPDGPAAREPGDATTADRGGAPE